jgi:hypothetical protein
MYVHLRTVATVRTLLPCTGTHCTVYEKERKHVVFASTWESVDTLHVLYDYILYVQY